MIMNLIAFGKNIRKIYQNYLFLLKNIYQFAPAAWLANQLSQLQVISFEKIGYVSPQKI